MKIITAYGGVVLVSSQVMAIGQAGDTNTPDPLGIPQNLSVENITIFSALFRFDQVDNATYYEIEYGIDSPTASTTTQLASQSPANLSPLNSGLAYRVRVRAANSTQNGDYSAWVTFIVGQVDNDESGEIYDGITHYVSSSSIADDSGTGTDPAAPIRSIARVNQILANATGPVNILFDRESGPDDFIGSILYNNTSGLTSNTPVKFGAYGSGNTRPNISGCQNLAQETWEDTGNNVWKLNINLEVWSQLTIDGQKVMPARSDIIYGSGYGKTGNKRNTDSFQVQSTDLVGESFTDVFSIEVAVRASNWHGESHRQINFIPSVIDNRSGANVEVGRFQLNDKLTGSCGDDVGIYIYNDPKYMTNPGDYFYNATTQELFILTSGASPSTEYDSIYGIRFKDGIEYRGNHLRVNDLKFTHFDNAVGGRSGNLEIDHCTVEHCYNSAVFAFTNMDNCWFHHMNIYNCSGNGVQMKNSSNCIVNYNRIDQIAMIDWGRNSGRENTTGTSDNHWGIGIDFRPSSNNEINYNTITNCGYACIRADGRNHEVAFNLMKDGMQNLQDGGNFYAFSGTGAIVPTEFVHLHHNISINAPGSDLGYWNASGATKSLCCNFYFDLRCRDCIIEDNFGTNADEHGLLLNKTNIGHTIRRNIIHDFTTNGISFNSNKGEGKQTIGHIVENNIMISTQPNTFCVFLRSEFNTNDYNPANGGGNWANNHYINPFESAVCDVRWVGGSPDYQYTYSEWIAFTGETGSVQGPINQIYVDRETSRAEYAALVNENRDGSQSFSLTGTFQDENGDTLGTDPTVVVPAFSVGLAIKS